MVVHRTVSLCSQSTLPRLVAWLLKVRWLSTRLCLCALSQLCLAWWCLLEVRWLSTGLCLCALSPLCLAWWCLLEVQWLSTRLCLCALSQLCLAWWRVFGGAVVVHETVSPSSQYTFPRPMACLLEVRGLFTGLCRFALSPFFFVWWRDRWRCGGYPQDCVSVLSVHFFPACWRLFWRCSGCLSVRAVSLSRC